MKTRGTLEILVGPSNSGKSTYANKKHLADPKNVVIVNRDKLREGLFGYTERDINMYYSRNDVFPMEKEVRSYEDVIIYDSLERGKHVIIDSTNLLVKSIEAYKYWNVETSITLFDVSLDVCLERNENRERSLPKTTIEKHVMQFKSLMSYNKFKELEFSIKNINNTNRSGKCVIVDMDGTLTHRVTRSPYDWKEVKEDTVDERVKFVTNAISKLTNTKVFILTARDGVCLDLCKEWLEENNITYFGIFIRPEGDMRPDWIVKEEIWDKINEEGYEITAMFDDRLQVVRRARMLGYKVFHVEYNNF